MDSIQEAGRRRPKNKNGRKTRVGRHSKVDGRDRRVRLPMQCAKTVFQLQEKLGFKTAGETVKWIMGEAMPAVDNFSMSINTHTVSMKSTINSNAYNVPMSINTNIVSINPTINSNAYSLPLPINTKNVFMNPTINSNAYNVPMSTGFINSYPVPYQMTRNVSMVPAQAPSSGGLADEMEKALKNIEKFLLDD